MSDGSIPIPEDIRAARKSLADRVVTTPTWQWRSRELTERLGDDTAVFLKLEIFQVTGTFKARGALLNCLDLPEGQGVTAVSAGNHAIAVAFAAQATGRRAKVVMPENADPFRVEAARAWGAEVLLAPDVHHAFERVRKIEREEGRYFVHPFDGPTTALGTATLGLELCEQVPDLDAVIIPVGGGGLCGGVAAAVKQMRPACRVIGVEPTGADSMHRSFAAGEPRSIERVDTIADSLGAPHAAQYSFDLCRRFVDELVKVDDDAIRHSMALLFREMKLALEPAAAAATAALWGPLRESLRGQRVALIVCGTNQSPERFAEHLRAAPERVP
ncbi:MAG: pyridoxal-phosphate dependent enzyme [Acidobacteriota bacterium]